MTILAFAIVIFTTHAHTHTHTRAHTHIKSLSQAPGACAPALLLFPLPSSSTSTPTALPHAAAVAVVVISIGQQHLHWATNQDPPKLLSWRGTVAWAAPSLVGRSRPWHLHGSPNTKRSPSLSSRRLSPLARPPAKPACCCPPSLTSPPARPPDGTTTTRSRPLRIGQSINRRFTSCSGFARYRRFSHCRLPLLLQLRMQL